MGEDVAEDRGERRLELGLELGDPALEPAGELEIAADLDAADAALLAEQAPEQGAGAGAEREVAVSGARRDPQTVRPPP
ncbi:MAG: hypothetical protein RML12_00975 [Xanthomonadales bacterium]|nr:hypothetical protein [Xanthomonadales bacterium]